MYKDQGFRRWTLNAPNFGERGISVVIRFPERYPYIIPAMLRGWNRSNIRKTQCAAKSIKSEKRWSDSIVKMATGQAYFVIGNQHSE